MKIAVIADIHGNYRALEALLAALDRWQPDAVLVAGDIVNRGPRSLDCLNVVRAKLTSNKPGQRWYAIKGNHEDYVIGDGQPPKPGSLKYQLFQPVYFTAAQLGAENVAWLSAMQDYLNIDDLTAIRGEFRIAHASMKGNRIGIFPDTTETELPTLISPPPAVLAVGHTHVPLIRTYAQSLVVNVGSVGIPFDLNPLGAYGQITFHNGQWHAEIIRFDYDRAAALADLESFGFMDAETGGGPIAKLIRYELQHAHSMLYGFTHRFQTPVLNGELPLVAAVERYLGEFE